jgi:hypothetical protein
MHFLRDSGVAPNIDLTTWDDLLINNSSHVKSRHNREKIFIAKLFILQAFYL